MNYNDLSVYERCSVASVSRTGTVHDEVNTTTSLVGGDSTMHVMVSSKPAAVTPDKWQVFTPLNHVNKYKNLTVR
jgi:hypothetical protein